MERHWEGRSRRRFERVEFLRRNTRGWWGGGFRIGPRWGGFADDFVGTPYLWREHLFSGDLRGAGKMPALPSVFPRLAEFAETFWEGANLPLL